MPSGPDLRRRQSLRSVAISFPRSAGHIPCFYNHRSGAPAPTTGSGTRRRLAGTTSSTPGAAVTFGHGLSYTTFAYRDLAPRRAASRPMAGSSRRDRREHRGARRSRGRPLYLTDCFAGSHRFVKRRAVPQSDAQAGEHRASLLPGCRDFAFITSR